MIFIHYRGIVNYYWNVIQVEAEIRWNLASNLFTNQPCFGYVGN